MFIKNSLFSQVLKLTKKYLPVGDKYSMGFIGFVVFNDGIHNGCYLLRDDDQSFFLGFPGRYFVVKKFVKLRVVSHRGNCSHVKRMFGKRYTSFGKSAYRVRVSRLILCGIKTKITNQCFGRIKSSRGLRIHPV